MNLPSPQPMSKILSSGCGSRSCRSLEVSWGTKEAAALYVSVDQSGPLVWVLVAVDAVLDIVARMSRGVAKDFELVSMEFSRVLSN